MPKFTAHEVMDLQEHIRVEAATAAITQHFSQMASDQDLRTFCEQEARIAQSNFQRLMALFQMGQQGQT